MSLRVLEPGLQTLVVDYGRPNWRSLGVPVGGTADRTSLALGNALVGNPPDAAALEVCLAGPTLEAQCELACVVYGAPFELASNRKKLCAGKSFTLQAKEVLAIWGTNAGMRAYLCVAGGLQCKAILGSRSGFEPVKKDAVLHCNSAKTLTRFAPIHWQWDRTGIENSAWLATMSFAELILQAEAWGVPLRRFRTIDGPQSDWFFENAITYHDSKRQPTLIASKDSNRMGIRLECKPRITIPNRELISEPVCPGSVQVTRDGQCIILGVDGQTIGGYPKIAQVISADLDLLGQLRPGEKVSFQRVTREEAERLWHAKQRELHHWVTRMQCQAMADAK
jgi:antagonist of KipI